MWNDAGNVNMVFVVTGIRMVGYTNENQDFLYAKRTYYQKIIFLVTHWTYSLGCRVFLEFLSSAPQKDFGSHKKMP